MLPDITQRYPEGMNRFGATECFDEDTKEVDCCPICCLYKELHEISENTFYIEYQNKKMYDKFEEIANKHGYKMIITEVEKREMVKFYKG